MVLRKVSLLEKKKHKQTRERTFRRIFYEIGMTFSMNKGEIRFVSLSFRFFSFLCVNLFLLAFTMLKKASFLFSSSSR